MAEEDRKALLGREGDEIWIQSGYPVGDGLGLALRIGDSSGRMGRVTALSYSEARRLAVRLMTAAEDGEAADREEETRRATRQEEEMRSIAGVRTELAMPQVWTDAVGAAPS